MCVTWFRFTHKYYQCTIRASHVRGKATAKYFVMQNIGRPGGTPTPVHLPLPVCVCDVVHVQSRFQCTTSSSSSRRPLAVCGPVFNFPVDYIYVLVWEKFFRNQIVCVFFVYIKREHIFFTYRILTNHFKRMVILNLFAWWDIEMFRLELCWFIHIVELYDLQFMYRGNHICFSYSHASHVYLLWCVIIISSFDF